MFACRICKTRNVVRKRCGKRTNGRVCGRDENQKCKLECTNHNFIFFFKSYIHYVNCKILSNEYDYKSFCNKFTQSVCRENQTFSPSWYWWINFSNLNLLSSQIYAFITHTKLFIQNKFREQKTKKNQFKLSKSNRYSSTKKVCLQGGYRRA